MLSARFRRQSANMLCTWVLSISLILFLTSSVVSKPRRVTWEDLKELKDGKIPENSRRQLLGGLFGKGSYEVLVCTPRAQAAQFANYAKENYIKLDSSTYFPEKFNKYVKLKVTNLLASECNSSIRPEDVRQITRGVIVIGDDFYEADSTVLVESTLQNALGAQYTNIDAILYFRLQLFSGWDDIKIVIFDNQGKVERKMKAKHVKKLE